MATHRSLDSHAVSVPLRPPALMQCGACWKAPVLSLEHWLAPRLRRTIAAQSGPVPWGN